VLFPDSVLMVVFCTSSNSRIIKGNYWLLLIEFTQQHPTPPREVITSLVITSLFFAVFSLACGHVLFRLPS
jgi:hypothetical protein